MLTTPSPRGANNHFALSIRFSFVWNLEAMFTTGHRVPRKVGSGTTTHFLLQLPPIFFFRPLPIPSSVPTYFLFRLHPIFFWLLPISSFTTHFLYSHYPLLHGPVPILPSVNTNFFNGSHQSPFHPLSIVSSPTTYFFIPHPFLILPTTYPLLFCPLPSSFLPSTYFLSP